MELWIRSQDREILKKVNGIEFIQSGSPLYEGIKYSIYESDENGKKMGEYKTKERALEVLNAIQQAMIEQSAKNERSELIGGIMGGSIPKKDVFIQMPED